MEVRGFLDDALVEQLGDELMAMAPRLKDAWGAVNCLIDLGDAPPISPESARKLTERSISATAILRKMAHVGSRALTKMQIRRINDDAGTGRVFSTTEEALAWLAE